MAFNYFYEKNAEQYGMIKIPKLLVTETRFADVSLDAKFLYGILIDRMSMAKKNKWIDEKNHVYVIYPLVEIQNDLGISKQKARACLEELERVGLIEKQSRGLGVPNRIYLKNFMKVFR